MAIYHINITPISRSAGRSATAASAYRSATKILDERTGETHDYTAKRGVAHSEILTPSGTQEEGTTPLNRAHLWNAAEAAERKENSRIAREVEVALPQELSPGQRLALTRAYAAEIAARYRCAVDIAIHKPHREGDVRNHHAHLLLTTREWQDGKLGPKTSIELSDRERFKRGMESGRNEVKHLRQRWAALTNEHLKSAGLDQTVDHRSLADQGIDRAPTKHFGPVVAERLRRGKDSYVANRIREEQQRDATERLASAAKRGQLEREAQGIAKAIIDTETDLGKALHQRARSEALRETAQTRVGVASTSSDQRPDPASRSVEKSTKEAQTIWLAWRAGQGEKKTNPAPEKSLIWDSERER